MQITEPAKRVGREIKAQMIRTGTKQADLAQTLGLSQAAVSRRLSGEVPFDVTELDAVATVLGVTASSFLVEVAA